MLYTAISILHVYVQRILLHVHVSIEDVLS